jgi:serine/threonine protein kinase
LLWEKENMQDASSLTGMPRLIGRQASVVSDGRRDESRRYFVLRKIGEGGYGAVYEAKDTFYSEKLVAIKSINLAGLSATEMIEATDGFNREVKMLTGLHHSHLPRVYDHFTDSEHWYVVMDYISGETLEEYLERQRRSLRLPGIHPGGLLPLSEVFEIVEQLCSVLNYLHSQQPPVIFRDLKPGNIMRTPSGHLYLIDFGIARRFKPGQARDTIPLGSPGYAAPEQYGKHQTDQRADIYSLGALVHHLLTGDDPSENAFKFAPLPNLPNELFGLDRLLASMLDLDPQHRPKDTMVVTRAISSYRLRPILNRPKRPLFQSQSTAYYTPSGSGGQQAQVQQHQQRKKKIIRRLVLGGALALGVVGIANAGTAGMITQFFQQPGQGPSALAPQIASTLVGELEESIPETAAISTKIAWAPDGSALAFYKSGGLGSLIPGVYIRKFSTHQLSPFPANLSSSLPKYLSRVDTLLWQEYLVIGIDNGTIVIWDVEKQELVRELPNAYGFSSGAIAAGPRKGLIAGSNGMYIHLWSIQDPKLAYRFFSGGDSTPVSISSYINALAISPSGLYIAAISIDDADSGGLGVWKTSGDYEQMFSRTFTTEREKAAIALSWSSKDLLACVNGNGLVSCFTAKGEVLWQRYLNWPYWQEEATVSWSPDGLYLAVTTPGSWGLYVWDAQGGAIAIDIKDSNMIKQAIWNPKKTPSDRLELMVTKVDDGIEIWKLVARRPID